MTQSFVLTLDTSPPAITLGESSGTVAGDKLQLEYITSEPISVAQLKLADGRVLNMVVGQYLTAVLPADAPTGWATLTVVDAVGNARATQQAVYLTGATAPPPVTAPPRGPVIDAPSIAEPEQLSGNTIHSSSTVGVNAVSAVSVQHSVTASLAYMSAAAVRGDASVIASEARVRSSAKTRVRHGSRESGSVGTVVAISRQDGPDETEAILHLLL